MPVGTGFVGAGDTLATDCSTLKHRRGGTFSWRSTTPTSAFAPKSRGSRRISRNRPTAVDTPPCIQSARLCEPFTGTGTFVARLLQLGVIPPEALEHKYKNDIFANEFVLLSYYIASINIEQVYHQVRTEQCVDEGYVEFPGMTLTDTFQLHEGDGTITEDFEGLAANNERAYNRDGAWDEASAAFARAALSIVIDNVVRLLAPYLPYVTEEVWSWYREGACTPPRGRSWRTWLASRAIPRCSRPRPLL